METQSIQEEFICPSCGTSYRGRFCNSCGEKRLEKNEMTIGYFFSKVWNALTFTDVKFLRSIKALLFKPGQLTAEYFAGRHKLYTAPLALFFFINLVYFLYQPVDALNSALISQMKGQAYSSWAEQRVNEYVGGGELTFNEFEAVYNQMSAQVSKLFLIVFVFLFAIWLAVVNVIKKQLFFYHLIAATHYVSFAILTLLIVIPFIGSIALRVYMFLNDVESIEIRPNAWYLTLPGLLILISYAFGMSKKLYYNKWYISLPLALLIVFGFMLSVLGYRLFLFVTTMLMIS